jgi:F-type H+-transporting ATPase subunit h
LTYLPTADLVQELYLRELKAYKPPQLKASDAEGQVQKFSVPKPPKSPEETDIANELKAYEASTVELEGQAGTEGGSAPVNEDWFEEEPEEDNHAKH